MATSVLPSGDPSVVIVRLGSRGVGAALVVLLVIVALLVAGALAIVITIPQIALAQEEAKINQDADNLKEMFKAFVAGRAYAKPVPAASGYKFWLALYVGDERGGPLGKSQVYLVPGDAAYLCSPNDPLNAPEATEQAIRDALRAGSLADLGPEHCSYAGPKAGVTRQMKKLSGRVVGATGSRGGVGFFERGFNFIKGNLEVEFAEYEALAREYGEPWMPHLSEPVWSSDLLQWVEPLPAK